MSSDHEKHDDNQVARWIAEARAGSAEALGRLMEFSRQYLLLIANDEVDAELAAKAGPSDLVQETQMEAVRGFKGFRGESAAHLLAWMRQILLHNVRDFTRRFADVAKRQVGREVPLVESGSSHNVARELVADVSSPSSHLRKDEQVQRVERAVDGLPNDYRQVIVWHHREHCSFEEIGRRLGRSEGAVRKLWSRGIKELQERLQAADESA